MFFSFDHLLYVTLPMMALLGLAQLWVKGSVGKYSRIQNRAGVTGAQCAMGILREAGIHNVSVELTQGWLSDHYDLRSKVIRLSPDIHNGRTIAAVGIAAHEAGHAIQDAKAYAPLKLRNAAVPIASIGSSMGWVVLVIGVLMGGASLTGIGGVLVLIGIAGVAAIALFQVINLPVEFDASRRALQILPAMGILDQEELVGARRMLTAAAMTYVAATVAAIWELLYWLWRLGIIGGSRQ